jgi:hypothetical protein
MDPKAFIEAVIDAGQRGGVAALDADQRFVWLISEAEMLCDMEGIDAFLASYFPLWGVETAAAFAEVGADEIAAALRAIAGGGQRDQLLDCANALITSRAGYDYESIREAVERRLARRSP